MKLKKLLKKFKGNQLNLVLLLGGGALLVYYFMRQQSRNAVVEQLMTSQQSPVPAVSPFTKISPLTGQPVTVGLKLVVPPKAVNTRLA